MTAKVICMASAKGGSGKTVLTATFGSFLATALNKKVLLIDTDAATNGLTMMYLKEVMEKSSLAKTEGRIPQGTYNSISDGTQVELVSLNIGVQLVPASYEFFNTENIDQEVYSASLKCILAYFKPSYDYIFIDAQAGSDVYAEIAISKTISDDVVIVSEYDPISAAGVERLKGLFRDDLTPDRTWVLLNKMLPEFVQSFSDFLEVARYLSPIPWDADVVRAYARRKIALNLETGNEYTLAVMKTTKVLLGENVAEQIIQWANQRVSVFRQPIEEQYTKVEQELMEVLKDRTKSKNWRLFITSLTMVSLCVILSLYAFFWFNDISDEVLRFVGVSKMQYWYSIIAFLVASASLFFMLILKLWEIYDWINKKTETLRSKRREAYLEEKLRKLEALRYADFEAIAKNSTKFE